MPLESGSHLGNYEIVDRLGAGGMGEVYRARDLRLGRLVALKVILEAYASDSQRVERFQREARLLAALNHPRIASLYGFEQAGGVRFLVMELVEGETLAERLRRGSMPIEEAIAIGLQIADALEAAHEKGVIHRDLKPANVKITPESQVKVLDFGLAKAVENEASQEAANSPTLSAMATQAGLILGTAAYMSPEQAKGFAADHRSDVFSFGIVLFEMLTGRQPFQGETAAEILASVLVREPEVSGLPADINPRLTEVITRCLQKNPKRRWQHIGDVRAELEAIASSPRSMIGHGLWAGPPKPLWRRALLPAACALIAASLTGTAAWWWKPIPSRAPLISFSHVLPEGQRFASPGRSVVAISPDGTDLVYVVAGERRLQRRPLEDLNAAPIHGTEDTVNVSAPVFSPDGQSLLYFAVSDRTLKRIPLAGGVPLTICPATNPTGIDWSDDGIVFADNEGISRVAPGGGKTELLVPRAPDVFLQMPQMLPDGQTLLFSITNSNAANRWDVARVVVHSLKTGVQKTVIEPGSSARYLRSGQIVYTMGGTLFAITFDVDRLETRGTPVPVIEGVARASTTVSGVSQFSVSDTGTIAYVPGAAGVSQGLDVFVANRSGAELKLMKLPPAAYNNSRVSRDDVVALESDEGGSAQVLIYGLAGTSAIRRLTFGGNNRFPIWTPDGKRVTFQSDREGDAGVFWQDADGSGAAQRLTRSEQGESHIPESWAPDGQSLLVTVLKNGKYTLSVFSLRDRKVLPVPGAESAMPIDAMFHPNGKWVVYRAAITGRDLRPAVSGDRRAISASPSAPRGRSAQSRMVAGWDGADVCPPAG
jgi:eukaryotic-like serine/threonine-protein kinase